jgi:hypothetical protein
MKFSKYRFPFSLPLKHASLCPVRTFSNISSGFFATALRRSAISAPRTALFMLLQIFLLCQRQRLFRQPDKFAQPFPVFDLFFDQKILFCV